MSEIDNIIGRAFKIAIVIYILVFIFRAVFRPDIYRIIIVPLEYCVGAMLIYIVFRWTASKVRSLSNVAGRSRLRGITKIVAVITVLIVLVVGGEYLLHRFSLTQEALHALRESTGGKDMLGTPIKTGWFITIQMQTKGQEGSAVLSIPVRGSKVAGQLDAKGIRTSGSWHVVDLSLTADGRHDVVHIPH